MKGQSTSLSPKYRSDSLLGENIQRHATCERRTEMYVHDIWKSKIWIDAICINQDNKKEKEVQVLKMHYIYREAKGVYVWHGREENDSNLAISAINKVQDATRDVARDKNDVIRLMKIKPEAKRLFNVSMFKPMADLSRRTWFRRLWIAQEYFCAQPVLFFCGVSILEDAKFTDVVNSLSIYSFGGQEPPGFREELELFAGFRALLDLKEAKISHLKGDKLSFFDFVLLGRERLVKEPVDRIYAAFGMAEGTDTIYRKEILIDYSEDARRNYWKAYSNFGKIALLHEPNLRLLSIASSVEQPESLPSWCPNLNSTPFTAEFDNKVDAAGWMFKEHGGDYNDSESSLSPRCIRHSNFKGKDDNHVLTSAWTNSISIWGRAVGRISALAQPCEWNPDIDIEDISSMRRLAKGMLEWFTSNEKFCGEQIADTVTAEFFWGEILIGAEIGLQI
jgi:hypothetical protein